MTPIPKGLRKCHHPAVSSVVLRDEPMLRAFIADGPSGARTVAPHSHRTSLRLTVLRGTITHHLFEVVSGGTSARLHTYRSPLLGGTGLSQSCGAVGFWQYTSTLSAGGSLALSFEDIHTVEWSDDAVWLVDEGAVRRDTTMVLLRAHIDDMGTDGLYEPMDEAEYAERCGLVWRLAAAAGVTP